MSEFKREHRYEVIKLSKLSDHQRQQLNQFIQDNDIPLTECVVVESDWPIYEHTWRAIELMEQGNLQDSNVPPPIPSPMGSFADER